MDLYIDYKKYIFQTAFVYNTPQCVGICSLLSGTSTDV